MKLTVKRLFKLSQKKRDLGNGFVNTIDKSETLPNDKHENMFNIEKGVPEPLRKVNYEVLLGIIETLKQLKPGESFPIGKDLVYPVTKMKNTYFSDYKIRILQTGNSYRVFRRA